MKYFIMLCLFFCVGCGTDQKDENKIASSEPENKLSGDEYLAELEKLDLFNLTDSSELEVVKASFRQSYVDLNFFQGELRGESLAFMDNRYQWIDCEELFEVGGITAYLKRVQPVFNKLGLKLEFGNEKSEVLKNGWNHSIEINGHKYDAFNQPYSSIEWRVAFVNFLNMLNAELANQGSTERFYPVTDGNDGSYVLLTPDQFAFVQENFPRDRNHPKTLAVWKIEYGL